jgi:TonB family protein
MNGIQTARSLSFLGFTVLSILVSGLFAQDTSSPTTTYPNALPCKQPWVIPDPTHMVRPKYPKQYLKAGVEGSVELRALVGSNGKTQEVKIVKGDPVFATPAAEAVHKWHFHAALVQGKPVETVYKVRVRFVLSLEDAIPDWEIESPRDDSRLVGAMPTDLEPDTPDGPVYRVSAQQGVLSPIVIQQVDPEFSEKARKFKEQGTVVLSLIVGTDGTPRSIKVECGPTPDLSEKAVEAVRAWRFKPGTKDGKPVMVQIAVEVEFHLFDSP